MIIGSNENISLNKGSIHSWCWSYCYKVYTELYEIDVLEKIKRKNN